MIDHAVHVYTIVVICGEKEQVTPAVKEGFGNLAMLVRDYADFITSTAEPSGTSSASDPTPLMFKVVPL